MTAPECNGMCLMGNDVMPSAGHHDQAAYAHPECPRHSPWDVWMEVTPVQAEALRATATAMFRDPAELALELLPLLMEVRPTENFTPPPAVNDSLTALLPIPLRPTPYPRSTP